jgi:adenylate cyclase
VLTLPRFFAFVVVALALLAGAVLLVAVRTANQAVIKVGETARNDTATRIAAALESDLGTAERAVADFEQALTVSAVVVGDPIAVRRYLTAELIALRGLTDLTLTGGLFKRYEDDGTMVLWAQGRRQIAVFREHDGQIGARLLTDVAADSAADPTRHDTLRTAAHQEWRGRSLWSDLSYREGDAALPAGLRRKVMTVQKAIFDPQGKFVGVLRAGITSDTLDRFASMKSSDDPHRLFICDAGGRLVTRLQKTDLYTAVDEEGRPDPDGDLRVVPATIPPPIQAALDLARGGTVGGARLDVDGEHYFVTLVPVAQGRAQQWLVGIVVPASAYVGVIAHARDRLLGLMVLVVLVIAAVGLGGARTVGRGMRTLVTATEGMRRFTFDAAPVQSPFAEVRGALGSVERAKTALRAMVKYVPVGLVRRLYESGRDPVLGADLLDVSLMFTDIADFTTHAEKLPPPLLADALGRYLQAATAAVEALGGTVDKYIGDALMVIWNAPDPVADHAVAACRAALTCAAATDQLGRSPWWQKAGLAPWRTRFGLHAAQVMVGHFGAPDRLSYTAMGDGVNLAARLEGLNKVYGTTILVSEEIRNRVGERFLFRRVDRVAVKGRNQSIFIFELLGVAGDPLATGHLARLTAYEDALAAAHRREFQEALDLLAPLTDDAAGAVLADRCRHWKQEPPPADWDGTWVAASK